MSNLTAQLLPQVVNAINTYGVTVTVYRDVYENKLGVKTLTQKKVFVCNMKAVIDNSAVASQYNQIYQGTSTIHKPVKTATLYYAYNSAINLERGDYIIIDGIRYILDVPQDILHYHVLYQVDLEATVE